MIHFVSEQFVRHASAATLGMLRQLGGFALHCGMITILAIIGVTSLNWDGNPDFHTKSVSAIQALFALLLLSFVVVRCVENWRRAASVPRRGLRDFDRVTACSVYGLLYFLLGYQLLRDIVGMTSLHVERCRFFVACGIVGVIIVRATALLQRRLNFSRVYIQRG
jgi:hypothetical protein